MCIRLRQSTYFIADELLYRHYNVENRELKKLDSEKHIPDERYWCAQREIAVSYTHLTLQTIYSV